MGTDGVSFSLGFFVEGRRVQSWGEKNLKNNKGTHLNSNACHKTDADKRISFLSRQSSRSCIRLLKGQQQLMFAGLLAVSPQQRCRATLAGSPAMVPIRAAAQGSTEDFSRGGTTSANRLRLR